MGCSEEGRRREVREGASLSRAGRRRAWRREEEGQWDPWRQMVVMAAATQTELK